MIQWALNTGFREIYGSTPYHVKFGRAPRRALSTLASSTRQDWQVDVLDDKALRKKVQSVMEVRSQLHQKVLDKVQANRGKQRAAASRGNLPNFAVGEYVLVAQVRRSGSTLKLPMTWTGPGPAQRRDAENGHGVYRAVACCGSSMTARVRRAKHRIRGSWRRLCCSDSDGFLRGRRSCDQCRAERGFSTRFHASRVFTQGEFEMAAIVGMAPAENGSGFKVEVKWVGFSEEAVSYTHLTLPTKA